MLSLYELQSAEMKQNIYNRNLLMAIFKRSFFLGAGSILSLSGSSATMQQLRKPVSRAEDDAKALYGDWARVGKQIILAAKSATK